MEAKALRAKIATGAFKEPTTGYCDGYVQANFLALPQKIATSFLAFANANPKPIPILEVIEHTPYSETLAKGG